MNRSLVIFLVAFGTAFGGAYLLKRGASSLTIAGPAADAAPAHRDGPSAGREERDAVTAASADGPDQPDQDETPHAQSGKTSKAERTPRNTGLKRGVVTRRLAPAPADTDGSEGDLDLDRLQGTWQIVDTEYDGNRLAEEAQEYSWEFRGNKYTIKHKGHFQELWAARLDSGRTPKTINATNDPKGARFMGIYELDGDSLRVCYDLTRKGRPDSFTAPKGSRRACYYFKQSN